MASSAGKVVFGRGGAAIFEPTQGEVIAGPLYGAEGIVVADCDLRRGMHARRVFDVAGHYSRTDVLANHVASPAKSAAAAPDTTVGTPTD